ncbi:MAG: secondary thiamine-phosphate synthase enzyme YjbQ [Candidatus Pacearchaeota archaeon]|jgi:secondary thiamine-phosphate synthase enzyme
MTKVYSKKIVVNTKNKIDFVNITNEVKRAVQESGIQDGIVLVNSMHITSSVFINDNEAGLLRDFKNWLEELAPQERSYFHNQTGEHNGFAHLWRTIMGRETVIAISDWELDLGPYEEVFYGEFDGQRDKKILFKVIGE